MLGLGWDLGAERAGWSRPGGSRLRCERGPVGLLAAFCDPELEVLWGDPEAGAELDGAQLAVVDRSSYGFLGELAGAGYLPDREEMPLGEWCIVTLCGRGPDGYS